MPSYLFKSRDGEGNMREGTVTVAGPDELRAVVQQRGWYLLSYDERAAEARRKEASPGGAAKPQSLAFLCWQLYTAVDAGIPLGEAIDLACAQLKDEVLREVMIRVKRDLNEGLSFSQALGAHPVTFSKMFTSLIHAGEVASALPEMLHKLAQHLDKQAERRGKVVGALAYPAVLLVISSAAVFFLLTFVTPRFQEMFSQLGGGLPAPTRALIAAGNFMSRYWIWLLAGFGVVAAAFEAALHTRRGRLVFDRWVLSAPLVGPLLHNLAISRVGDTLATMLSSGVPILTALPIVAASSGNEAISQVVVEGIEEIKKGKSIGGTLGKSPLIPGLMTSMIQVGEQTGELGELMRKVSVYLDREVDQAITRFSKLIEPVMLVGMTAVIGAIAVAIFMPLAEITQQISK